jgi:hypothetical protein
MKESYDPVLSKACSSGYCDKCDGIARLVVNGEEFVGKCQHEICHTSFKKKPGEPIEAA